MSRLSVVNKSHKLVLREGRTLSSWLLMRALCEESEVRIYQDKFVLKI